MKPDGRADWCSLGYVHGPHGPKSKQPCPGYAPATSRKPRRAVKERSSKATVAKALSALNVAALALGMRNRFEIEYGSASKGLNHKILDWDPAFTTAKKIEMPHNWPLVHLEAYINGMETALRSAKAEQDRQEEALSVARRRAFETRPHDPDARSVRRGYQSMTKDGD